MSPLPRMHRVAATAARYFDSDYSLLDAAAAAASRAPFAPSPLAAAARELASAESARRWHRFYASHGGRFFHERSVLAHAVPPLAAAADGGNVLEVGCGSGANVFNLLALLPDKRTHVFACDVTPAALRALRSHARFAEEAARVDLCLWDAVTGAPPAAPPGLVVAEGAGGAGGAGGTGGGADVGGAGAGSGGASASRAAELNALHASFMRVPRAISGGEMDVALLTFVLSALDPRDHASAVASVVRALRPGGLLCVRDHAAGDAAMLRAAEANRLGERLFVRGDGTLAYFFALDELRSLLENAGLVNVDLKLALVETRNRKTGARIRRIFATGSAVKST